MDKGGISRGEGNEHSDGVCDERSEVAAAVAVPGLVISGTSHTQAHEPIVISGSEARVKGMRKAVLTAGRLSQDDVQRRPGGFQYKGAMLTVTYSDIDGGRPDHIAKLTNHMRTYLARRGHKLLGVWVAELQQRGAVHYHFVVWLPKGVTLPMPDKQGWWPHGMTQWQWARRAVGYLVKYASKVDSKHKLPKGCRISGACGLNRAQRTERRWWRMPRYVRQRWPDWGDDVVRAKGGGFVAHATGEYMPPLFAFAGMVQGCITLYRLDSPEWEDFFRTRNIVVS